MNTLKPYPKGKRTSFLATDNEVNNMKQGCAIVELPIKHDKEAGTLEIFTKNWKFCLFRAVQKQRGGSWVVTMMADLFVPKKEDA